MDTFAPFCTRQGLSQAKIVHSLLATGWNCSRRRVAPLQTRIQRYPSFLRRPVYHPNPRQRAGSRRDWLVHAHPPSTSTTPMDSLARLLLRESARELCVLPCRHAHRGNRASSPSSMPTYTGGEIKHLASRASSSARHPLIPLQQAACLQDGPHTTLPREGGIWPRNRRPGPCGSRYRGRSS